MASTSHACPAPTLPIILLIEQREDLDVPSPQVLHVVPQALLAVLHRREGHERLAAGPLQAVLSDHHRRLAQRVARQVREFGRFGVADVGMFFYNIIKAIIYSCLLNSAIFLIAILICCYLQDAVKATSVTAIIIFGLSLYLGYGMMLRLPVGFLPTYQIRIVVSMKTFFQPIAILVGCIWSGILVLLSWIKFCKCDFK